jgi:hypothetical protein
MIWQSKVHVQSPPEPDQVAKLQNADAHEQHSFRVVIAWQRKSVKLDNTVYGIKDDTHSCKNDKQLEEPASLLKNFN